MPRVLTRSPIKMPGTRQCRLARRLAAGLSPAEIRRLDTATEEDIEAFVTDRDLSRLVDQYAAVRNLPLAERQARLFETAWLELSSLIDVGDRRAMLFVVYQANRARHPVRHLVKLVVDSASTRRASPTSGATRLHPPAPRPRRCRATASIRWARRRTPSTASSTSSPPRRARLFLSAPRLEPPAAEAPIEEPVAATEEIPPGDVGDPASADSFSPLAALARANPALADWIIARIEKRLAELGAEEPEPDGPRRPPATSPSAPDRQKRKKTDLTTSRP